VNFLEGQTVLTHRELMHFIANGDVSFGQDGGYLAVKRAIRDQDTDRIIIEVKP